MAADSELRRRVTRLENDTESIYEILAAVSSTQQKHTTRLDGIDTRLDGIDTSLGALHITMAEVVRRLPEPT
jgi:hypothetical protein